MKYSSVITSKGTITIPSEIRQKNGLKQGMRVEIFQDETGAIQLKRAPKLEELRRRNQGHLKKLNMWPLKDTLNDQGFEVHIREKYGR